MALKRLAALRAYMRRTAGQAAGGSVLDAVAGRAGG
jgi:hypothetical protein